MNTRKISVLSMFLIFAVALSACTTGNVAGATGANSSSSNAAASTPVATVAATGSSAISLSGYEAALESIYAKVNPSVVNIRVTDTVQSSNGGSFNGFFFSSPNQQGSPQTQQALGSGFVWDKAGHIVTNNHVIDGATSIQIKFADGTYATAKVIGTDVNSDLAVLQLQNYTGTLVPITSSDSSNVKVGEVAVAIGNPYGLENTMTVGIVSAIGRSLPTDQNALGASFTIPNIIQTDAPINPGNSGGVLVNDSGELIGVTADIVSNSGSNAGIGFAIPSNTVNKVIPELIKSGKYEHAYLGITGATVTPDIASAMKLDANQRGVLVVDVAAGSPADKAGLVSGTSVVTINGVDINVGGDIITKIDGHSLTSIDDLISYLADSTVVGQKVALTVLHNGTEKTVDATLVARPATVAQSTTQSSSQSQSAGSVYLGVALMPMTSDIASQMNLPTDTSGLLIEEVVTGSPADQAGLVGSFKPVIINSKRVMIGGDIIVGIDNQSISSVNELTQLLSTKKPGDVINVTIIRNATEQQVMVTLAAKPAS